MIHSVCFLNLSTPMVVVGGEGMDWQHLPTSLPICSSCTSVYCWMIHSVCFLNLSIVLLFHQWWWGRGGGGLLKLVWVDNVHLHFCLFAQAVHQNIAVWYILSVFWIFLSSRSSTIVSSYHPYHTADLKYMVPKKFKNTIPWFSMINNVISMTI